MRSTGPTISQRRRAARGHVVRFGRYASISLITVPVGYALLLTARAQVDVNAGLLNLAVGALLTPPSYLLYRHLVWRGHTGQGTAAGMTAFWVSVLAGALVSSLFIGVADAAFDASAAGIVLAGLAGQGVVFLARYVWMDRVTFRHPPV